MFFNRPGVAGAVLQTAWSFNQVTNRWFVEINSKHCQSQTRRARELKFWENVHPTLCGMHHVSHVTCHESCVTSHVPPVLRHVSPVSCQKFIFLHLKKIL